MTNKEQKLREIPLHASPFLSHRGTFLDLGPRLRQSISASSGNLSLSFLLSGLDLLGKRASVLRQPSATARHILARLLFRPVGSFWPSCFSFPISHFPCLMSHVSCYFLLALQLPFPQILQVAGGPNSRIASQHSYIIIASHPSPINLKNYVLASDHMTSRFVYTILLFY